MKLVTEQYRMTTVLILTLGLTCSFFFGFENDPCGTILVSFYAVAGGKTTCDSAIFANFGGLVRTNWRKL